MKKGPVMRESGRQRERWDVKGSPSSTQQGNDWGILVKKSACGQGKKVLKRSWCNQCLLLTQDKQLYSIPPD